MDQRGRAHAFAPRVQRYVSRLFSPDPCIHELFEQQAARTPEATALVFEERQLSYGELNARANQLGTYLQELGVGPEVPVALCMERSEELVIGMLGILKRAGHTSCWNRCNPQNDSATCWKTLRPR